MKNSEPEPPSYTMPKFPIHYNYEIINVHCLKPQDFRVICNTEMDNLKNALTLSLYLLTIICLALARKAYFFHKETFWSLLKGKKQKQNQKPSPLYIK